MSVQIVITDPAELPSIEVERLIGYLESHLPAPVAAPAPIKLPDAVVSVGDTVVGTATEVEFTPSPFQDAVAEIITPVLVPAPVPPMPAAEAAKALYGHMTRPVGVELDVAGLPWDGRIHATTKTKLVDGNWKLKRGMDPDVVAQVTAELKAVMAAPTLAVEAAPAAPVAPTPTQAIAAEVAAEMTPPPPPPPAATEAVAPPPPPPAAAPTGMLTFPTFMQKVTEGIAAGSFTREAVNEACVACGIPALPGLISRPDLIPAVAAVLGVA